MTLTKNNMLLFNVGLLLIIILLVLVLSMVWPPDSPWAPWWRTSRKTARAMCRLAKVGREDVVYDLGCGDGTTLLVAASEFGARGVGIEIDPLRVLFSTLMIRIIRVQDKVVIKRRNFFDEDLSKATVVFVYLVPKALARLKPKFLKELKKGTRIASVGYEMDLPLEKRDQQHKIFLYVV